MDYMIDFKESK